MLALALGVALCVCVALCLAQRARPAPGLVWKLPYAQHPELLAIYERFVESCVAPQVPQRWADDARRNATFQRMRAEALRLDCEAKYEKFETQAMEKSEWAADVKPFYGNAYKVEHEVYVSPDALFAREPQNGGGCARHEYYVPRLGCFSRHIPQELERFAEAKLNELMARLGLEPTAIGDSRGATFMPAGGFMECHTNRHNQSGWRYYMHHLPENGKSLFLYRHPHDHTLRTVEDCNTKANMFRIRKQPPLWHSIVSDTPRFSWGLALPAALAHALQGADRR